MANSEILAVFETFQEQLKEIQGFQSIHVGGHVYGREQDRELRKTLLIETAVEDEEEALQRDLSVLRKLVLTYLVVLLEQMTKSYLRSCPSTIPAEMAPVNYDGGTYYSSHLGNEVIRKSWDYYATKWCKEVTEDRSPSEKEKAFTRLLASFDMTDAFVAGIAIRNIEIHNRGVMNERNHKHVPICDVGDRPEWNHGLLYQFETSLFLLNSRLKTSLMAPEGS